jgi:hypothetical protein
VAVGWVAVSHAEEKADDDAFLLACLWTGDHKATFCGGFPTRALCEREGRAAVANGELSKFRCISTADLAALLEAIGHIIRFEPNDQPTAAGPGGSDQPTFGQQITDWSMLPNKFIDPTHTIPPPPTTTLIPQQATGGPPGWAPATEGRGIGVPSAPTQPFSNWPRFMKNARPSANIEDYRRTRGKPFIVQ